jgi:hypothetical protein
MKKITLFIAFAFALNSNAQLLTENFDTALNWTIAHPTGTSTLAGWSRATIGSAPSCSPFAGAGMAKFASYDVAAANAYSLTSPAIAFAGANYRITFKMYKDDGYPTDADNIKVYLNTVASSVGGTLLGTVNRSISLAPTVAANGWYSFSFDLPAATTGSKYISLLATSAFGNNMFIDEISVKEILTNDAEMTSINLNSILPVASVGNNAIAGTIKNTGSNVITSININWQENGGVTHTQSLSGLNILAGQTYSYNHATMWNAAIGQSTIHIWVSNTNGGADTDLTNNDLTKVVSVASNATTRFPLYEKFTSSTCSPCASFGAVFHPFHDSNLTNLALINYQVNWPSTGDPYYTSEIGTRRNFYGVSGVPTLFVDAKDSPSGSAAALQSELTAEIAVPAYFAITSESSLNGNDVTVNITTTPYLTGTYRLFTAVVEKTTALNATTNGETSFNNVMMKMLPNAAGTILNCVHDTPITTTLTANVGNGAYINSALTGTALTASTNLVHTEDISDLQVIVFIQDYTTKMVMQAQLVPWAPLANNTFNKSKFSIFPNPSTGMVKIITENPVDVSVVDVLGKEVFASKNNTSNATIDLSSLQKGVYMIKAVGENGSFTEKLILK